MVQSTSTEFVPRTPPVSRIQPSNWARFLPTILTVRKPGPKRFHFNLGCSLTYCARLLAVGPTLDLSAFRDGLEVIVPRPLAIRVPITGYPTPTPAWTFEEKELTSAAERVSLVTRPSFTELKVVPSVRPDKGTYALQLENDTSSVSGEIDVNVIGIEFLFLFFS